MSSLSDASDDQSFRSTARLGSGRELSRPGASLVSASRARGPETRITDTPALPAPDDSAKMVSAALEGVQEFKGVTDAVAQNRRSGRKSLEWRVNTPGRISDALTECQHDVYVHWPSTCARESGAAGC